MLHIILGILKIIGIILALLLLLVCAVLLSVLFVPVRYRTEARKEGEQAELAVSVSWLLHIVSVLFRIDRIGKHSVAVRLFGIRLPLGGQKKTRDRKRKKRRRKKKEESPGKSKKSETEMTAKIEDSLTEADQSEDEAISEALKSEVTAEQPEDEATSETPESEATVQMPEDVSGEREIQAIPKEKSTSRKKRCKRSSICAKIKQITALFRRFWQWLKLLPKRLRQIYEKIRRLLRKPEELAELLQKYEVRENFGTVYGYLRYLWEHFRPRKITGHLRFGTGDPALTGQLTGLVYMMLPARADKFEVLPEFDGVVFETQFVCAGHIRAVHLLRVLIKGLRDKKLRKLIAKFRSRT